MVRTRFAPSPTGYLHIGGVRTALFNWLFARRHGGQFILRIDDTDQQRNIAEALQPILDGFRWLEIDWDEGPEVGGPHAPYYQSQRTEQYSAAVQSLIDMGAAYYDYSLPEEIQQERSRAEQEKRTFVYSRRWMAETSEDRRRFESQGRTGVVRLKMPREGSFVLKDLVRGDVTFAWEQEQDHVIQRADGTCLYHLATVCDDHDMEISHVIRAEEHLSNTPRQVFIFQSLGYSLPQFAHIPFVAEPGSKTKLSKRKLDKYLKQPDFRALYDLGEHVAAMTGMDGNQDSFNPVLVDFYRQIGFHADALVNYLLLLGWSLDDSREEFTRKEMIANFSLERVNKSPASFDPQKLTSFQDRYMQRVPVKQKVAAAIPFLQRAGLIPTPTPCDMGPYVQKIVEAAGDRLKFAGAIVDYADFFQNVDALRYDEKEFTKRIANDPLAIERLDLFRARLSGVDPFVASELEDTLRQFLNENSLTMKDMVQPIRIALTGKSVGFGLFETMEILGKGRCLARIERALEMARRHDG